MFQVVLYDVNELKKYTITCNSIKELITVFFRSKKEKLIFRTEKGVING